MAKSSKQGKVSKPEKPAAAPTAPQATQRGAATVNMTDAAEKRLAELNEQIQQAEATLKSTNDKIDAAHAAHSQTLEKERAELARDKEQTKKNLEESERLLAEAKAVAEDPLKQVREEGVKLVAKVVELETREADLKKDQEATRASEKHLQKWNTELVERELTAKNDLETAKNLRDQANLTLDRARRLEAEARATFARVESEKQASLKALETLNVKFGELQDRLTEVMIGENERAELKTQMEELVRQRKELASIHTQQEVRAAELERQAAQLADYQQRIDALRQEIQQLSVQKAGLVAGVTVPPPETTGG